MAQQIKIGDEIIEFPDDMSDAEITAVLRKQYGGPSQEAAPVAVEPKAAPQPQETSLMSNIGRQIGLTARAGGQGLADLAGIVTNPITALANQAAGRQIMTPIPELASQGMTSLGLPEPQSAVERAVQVGASSMMGTAGQAQLASKATKIVPSLSAFTDDLMKQFTVAGAGGTAAAGSAEYVKELTNDPLAATAAALATGVLVGGGAGKVVDTARNVKSFMQGATKPTLSMTDIKNRAQASYRTMDDQGVYVRSDSVGSKLFSSFDDTLKGESFNPSVVDTHKPVADVLNNLKTQIQDPFLSFTKLEQMRSSLTDLKTSSDAATRRIAGKLVADFDDYLSNVGYKDVFSMQGDVKTAINNVKSARVDWRNLSRAETIEDALSSALVRSDKATSSKSELIRNAMINLAANKKAMRPFSEAEQNAIRAVAKGGSVDTVLTMLAKFNPERNQIVAGGTLAGLGYNPVVTASVAGSGFLADKYLGAARQAAANRLVKQVASGTVPQTPQNMWWRGLLSSPVDTGQ